MNGPYLMKRERFVSGTSRWRSWIWKAGRVCTEWTFCFDKMHILCRTTLRRWEVPEYERCQNTMQPMPDRCGFHASQAYAAKDSFSDAISIWIGCHCDRNLVIRLQSHRLLRPDNISDVLLFFLYNFLSSFMLRHFFHYTELLYTSTNMVLIRRVPMEIWLSDPVMIAPPGMHSNFVNPSNLKTEGLILVVFCLTASMFVVAMRMWTKSRLVRKVALEDCTRTHLRSHKLNPLH